MINVVAALILRRNAEKTEMLICQRPAKKARGLLWEFVGGKVETGETPQEALVRECREELGVIVAVGEQYMEVVHSYPDLTVRLSIYRAEIQEGVPQLLEHNDLQWVTPTDISGFAFCPADENVLERIRTEGLPL